MDGAVDMPECDFLVQLPQLDMRLRDWLAGQALVAMGTWMPGPNMFDLGAPVACAARAVWAYQQADAMLKARWTPAEISERDEMIEALKRAKVSLRAFRDMAEGSSEESWPVMSRIDRALARAGAHQS
jgi:hypothetical protein